MGYVNKVSIVAAVDFTDPKFRKELKQTIVNHKVFSDLKKKKLEYDKIEKDYKKRSKKIEDDLQKEFQSLQKQEKPLYALADKIIKDLRKTPGFEKVGQGSLYKFIWRIVEGSFQ